MQRLGLPATFFVITGEVKGSKNKAQYFGKPLQEILKDTSSTNQKNFLERSSALRFSNEMNTKLGEVSEEGELQKAYALVDETLAKIRKGELRLESSQDSESPMSWDDFRQIAKGNYEFASHTISHPYLSVLDDVNMKYELEKSQQEIREQLGEKHTFSVECPYGTENPRAVNAALKVYNLSRNLMPDTEVQDLNRWDEQDPGSSKKQYVRWQRGPLSKTSLELMKQWVDTIIKSNNVWLVLVIHGVNGIGWEPIPHERLETYFKYIQSHDKDIWIATFQDAGKYIREKLATEARFTYSPTAITVTLTQSLDPKLYNLPLSLKTYVPSRWKRVRIVQDKTSTTSDQQHDAIGNFVMYQAIPNDGAITLTAE
ncbi:polysaccharide deacetylase family protein [bacterium]|nr:polysaccharide deacetylase family protein [bacterium]MCI0618096.1 polysaccharide deacetylase family protein [bacterium]